jgi:hypothetical protein
MVDQEYKLIPFSTGFKIRVILNDRNDCFTCANNNVPFIKIHEAYFEDWLVRCDSDFVNSESKKIISANGQMNFPVIRRELNMHDIHQTIHMKLNRAIIGDVPSRLFLFVARSDTFLAHNPTRNPYVYKFPGITKFSLEYGDKEWPRKDGVEFRHVPTDLMDKNRIRTLTDAEVEKLVIHNTRAYDILRGPFTAPNFLHKMAVKEKEWFKYCCVLCVDFSPLGCDFFNPDLRGPKSVGDIAIKIRFSGVMPADHKLVTISEYKNMVTWTVPDFKLSMDQ